MVPAVRWLGLLHARPALPSPGQHARPALRAPPSPPPPRAERQGASESASRPITWGEGQGSGREVCWGKTSPEARGPTPRRLHAGGDLD